MKISRAWAMPSSDTLTIQPIRKFFKKWHRSISVDPFARNCSLCDITNDLNLNTKAQFHLKADKFLMGIRNMNFVLFDPPYSLRQVKECYEGVGIGFTHQDSQNAIRWTKERNIIAEKQEIDDIVLSLGWTTTCMGKKRGYKIEEILIVSHGPAHNDSLCVIERKCTT